MEGEPLSDAKYDPFWAKAQELDVIVFMHPNGATNVAKEDAFKGRADWEISSAIRWKRLSSFLT